MSDNLIRKCLKLYKAVKFNWNKVRRFRENLYSSRDLVGNDKHGNRYFRAYDPNGNEIRRYVEYIEEHDLTKRDMAWQDWLHGHTNTPPTDNEQVKVYDSTFERMRSGRDKDLKVEKEMEEFRKSQAYKDYSKTDPFEERFGSKMEDLKDDFGENGKKYEN